MRDQIQRVLAMAKAGQLTDDQAAQLIEEIAQTERGPASGVESAGGAGVGGGAGERSVLERVVHAVSGGHSSVVSGVHASGLRENAFSMSHVDVRQNRDAVFQANVVRMSRVAQVELNASEMSENELHSATFTHLDVNHSALTGSTFFATSIDNVTFEDSTIRALNMRSGVWKDVKLENARFDDVGMSSTVLKQVKLGPNVEWSHVKLESVQAKGINSERSALDDVAFEATKISDLSVTGTKLRVAMVRGYRWKDVRLVDCVFEDVLFGGDGNRKCVFADVTFENCNISRSMFMDTVLADVTIRNVTIDNVKAMGVVLKDRVIDGNEQFLAAIGVTQSASPRAF